MNRRPDWLAHAHYLLGAARSHFEREYFGEVVVACYYAMFAGAKAIATRQGFEAKTHKGLWIDLQNNAGEWDLRTYLQMAHQYRHLYHYQMERPSETNAKGQIDATEYLPDWVDLLRLHDALCVLNAGEDILSLEMWIAGQDVVDAPPETKLFEHESG